MFRSLLDHQQVHKELKYATRNKFLWYTILKCFIQQCKHNGITRHTKEIRCTLNISAICRPDDGRVMTETCCLNEFI